jgi:polysaccharide pyruvyl transferase WcaK-like protein
MTVLLRSLEFLVTSRYHGCVLSLAAQVPQVALGHDLRLKTIYDELGFSDQFLVEPEMPEVCKALKERVEKLLANPELERESLRRGYTEHLGKAQRNRTLLRSFVQKHGWEVVA